MKILDTILGRNYVEDKVAVQLSAEQWAVVSSGLIFLYATTSADKSVKALIKSAIDQIDDSVNKGTREK